MKVGIIGAGISGLSCAYYLQDKFDVSLIESRDRIGGHANPIEVEKDLFLDTGFVIFNERSYPNFCQFLKDLNTPFDIVENAMSIGFWNEDLPFGYCTSSIKNFLSTEKLKQTKLFVEMIYFRKEAIKELESPGDISLEEFCNRFSERFNKLFLLPMIGLVWSMPEELTLKFSAKFLLRFLEMHGHLSGHEKSWRSFKLSSKQYLDQFLKSFNGKILLSTKTSQVTRSEAGYTVKTADGSSIDFDIVIIATHADQALNLIEKPSEHIINNLTPFQYRSSTAYLHHDEKIIPPDFVGCWNTVKKQGHSYMSYGLNLIHGLKGADKSYFLTLDDQSINENKIIKSIDYRHPVFNSKTYKQQRLLDKINESTSLYFCGSYFANGFHEDAITSSLKVVSKLLAT